jgi:UDP-glucose 4-epimerase
MIIAVTGATGSIGKELVSFLEDQGHVVLRISSSLPSNGRSIFSYHDLKSHSIEHPVECFIHLASLNSSLTESNIHIESQLAKDVLVAMKHLNCKRLIFFSTAKVYGDNSFASETFSESSPLNPSCPYSRAKKLCEDILLSESSQPGFGSIIFRLPPVLNQSDTSNLGRLMKLARRGTFIPLLTQGQDNQRSFISSNNIETVINHVIANPTLFKGNKLYNLADEGDISLNNLLSIHAKRKIYVLPRLVSEFFFKIPFLKTILLKLYGNFVLENSKLQSEMGVKLISTSKSLPIIYR